MIMLCGIGTGYLLRNKKMRAIGRVITVLIWLLLFLLGIEVGSNPRIVNGLQTLGLEAIVLTLAGRMCGSLTGAGASSAHRLPSHRFGLWLLFALQHLHHRVSWTGTGHHRLARQHLPRDTHAALCTALGSILWQVGTYQCGWSHLDGYHAAHHHPCLGRAVYRRLHLPWILCRLLRAVPRYLLLFTLASYIS